MAQKKVLEYTTTSGHKVKIIGVPPFLMDKVSQQTQYPSVPTYTVTTASGVEETHPHDETTLSTDAEKATWSEYVLALETAKLQENEILMNTMFLKGIEVDLDGPDFQDWVAEQRFLGIALPTEKPALKVDYIKSEILGSVEDITKIMSLIMSQSGVSQEVVDQATASFQSALSGHEA